MLKNSFQIEFTLRKEDKEYCDKIFKTYQKTFNYLSSVVFNLEIECETVKQFLKTNGIGYKFKEELNEVASYFDCEEILYNLNCSLIKKIETHFTEKYGLKFESLAPTRNTDYLSLHTYDLIIQNIKLQTPHLPEENK